MAADSKAITFLPSTGGRPAYEWTESLEETISKGLETQSLLKLLEANPELPSRTIVHQRMASDEAFRTKCARAMQHHAQHLVETMQVELMGAKTKEDAYIAGVKAAHVQWYASKLLPKIYGDKLNVDVEVTAKRVVSDL